MKSFDDMFKDILCSNKLSLVIRLGPLGFKHNCCKNKEWYKFFHMFGLMHC